MISPLKNPMLQQAETQLEGQLTPDNQADYHKIVTAGMAVALDKGPNGILASLAKSKDPVGDCARGAANLVMLMRKDAKGVMPFKAMVPAGTTLMIKALDFVQEIGLKQIDSSDLVYATKVFTGMLFHILGITQPMLDHAAGKIGSLVQDPAMIAKMNAKMAPHMGGA